MYKNPPSGRDPDSQIPFSVFKTNEVAGRGLSICVAVRCACSFLHYVAILET